MGKRKRAIVSPAAASSHHDALLAPDHALPFSPPAPDAVPCSSGMELLLKENSSHSVDSGETKPLSPVTDIADSKVPNEHNSIGHHQYGLGRSAYLKRSRHYYGHQYARRNSVHHDNASNSHGKFVPIRDERHAFKSGSQNNSESGHQAENRENPNSRTERIRASPLVIEAVSGEMVKTVCGICQKPLKWKPFNFGSALASCELSVVAVLVCGHFYHADCLEQRTRPEDRRDPTCPLCTGIISKDRTKYLYKRRDLY